MAKISVIMPVYNAEKYLRDAIDSIISQSFTDWELIIINDGSTDTSESIILSYSDPRISYHKNDNNLGLISTLNKAIDLCKGEYIARMDADDISEKERFKIQIAFLEENREYAMCGSYAKVINNENKETGKILNLQTNEFLQINLLFSVPFVHPSMMFRSKILRENNFDPLFKHAEDYDLWCRIAQNHKIANIPDFLLKYRWHTTNVSVTNSETQENVKNKIICRELKHLELIPTEEELHLHRVTFQQFDSKAMQTKNVFTEYKKLDSWFLKIIHANKTKKRYKESSLIAFLWSRWFVLCTAQKEYSQITKPKFIHYTAPVIYKTIRLLIFLNKKG